MLISLIPCYIISILTTELCNIDSYKHRVWGLGSLGDLFDSFLGLIPIETTICYYMLLHCIGYNQLTKHIISNQNELRTLEPP